MIRFTFLTVSAFIGTEIFSYFLHRYLFHGVLWRIHKTHHAPRRNAFELNDLFSSAFTLLAIFLFVAAEAPWRDSTAFPVGLGITVYGSLYFIAHDLFTHRRFLRFNSKNKILLAVRAAHQRHHQSAEKAGLEPFGLFFFDYREFYRKISRS